MEINVVTLHKAARTVPQQMRTIIKTKGGLLQKASVRLMAYNERKDEAIEQLYRIILLMVKVLVRSTSKG